MDLGTNEVMEYKKGKSKTSDASRVRDPSLKFRIKDSEKP
jgi:hypothetical protein